MPNIGKQCNLFVQDQAVAFVKQFKSVKKDCSAGSESSYLQRECNANEM